MTGSRILKRSSTLILSLVTICMMISARISTAHAAEEFGFASPATVFQTSLINWP